MVPGDYLRSRLTRDAFLPRPFRRDEERSHQNQSPFTPSHGYGSMPTEEATMYRDHDAEASF
jgi:hypothetical protein